LQGGSLIGIPDVITYANLGEDRLRGLGVAGGQSLSFSIDFDRRGLQHSRTTVRVCDVAIIMVALCNRTDHYIFVVFLLLSFFPRLISAVRDWTSTILPDMVWP